MGRAAKSTSGRWARPKKAILRKTQVHVQSETVAGRMIATERLSDGPKSRCFNVFGGRDVERSAGQKNATYPTRGKGRFRQ
jgi:hypothetical protein